MEEEYEKTPISDLEINSIIESNKDAEPNLEQDSVSVSDSESVSDLESVSGSGSETGSESGSESESESDTNLSNDIGDDDMNTNWIDEYEEHEKKYEDYYLESMEGVKAMFVYVNKERTIESIHEDYLQLQANNIMTKEEILYLIKNNNIPKNLKNKPTRKEDPYKLLSVLVYNIDLQPKQLKEYLEKKHPPPHDNPYLYSLKILEDVHFKKSISLFHDINTIYFIFYDNSHKKMSNNKTKKIHIKTPNSNGSKSSKTNNAKTKRKELKE